MQIHVQNAPFVYNPDTISVGLGFSKEGGKMTTGIQYIKNISERCAQFVVYPPTAFIYVLRHIKELATHKLNKVCLRDILCTMMCFFCVTITYMCRASLLVCM